MIELGIFFFFYTILFIYKVQTKFCFPELNGSQTEDSFPGQYSKPLFLASTLPKKLSQLFSQAHTTDASLALLVFLIAFSVCF